jgi:CMP-N-acetylneuraminic acid synthetase
VIVLGIIPARGGSKGILGKSLVDLAGRPLIAYTLDAARRSVALERYVVSTDDVRIAAFAREQCVEVPFIRPAGLAADDTPMQPVVMHAMAEMDRLGFRAEAVMVLQPTSPLRRAEHIDAAVEVMQSTGADTVVSVVEVPHAYNPVSLMIEEPGGGLAPYSPGEMVLRRQDKPRVYARNGPAILLIRRAVIEAGQLYGSHIRPLLMDLRDSIDIDRPDDLLQAAFWLGQRGGQ